MKFFSGFLLLLVSSVACSATADLMIAYNDALKYDPTYLEAVAQYRADRENFSQAVANAAPNIGLTGGINGTQQFSQEPRNVFFTPTKFGSHNYRLSLTQPIFDYGTWKTISQSRAAVKAAEATLRAAKQDLMIRLSEAYFSLLEAKDTLRFTLAEKRANERQLDQVKERFKVGLDAITSVYEAQASYDGVIANVITSRNNIDNARESLRQITGIFYRKVARLKDSIPLLKPKPNNIDAWTERATQQNYTYLAACFNADAAKEQIKVAFAGHLPTLDFVASIENRNTLTAGFSQDDANEGVVGVQLNFPVFQGGLVMSQVRQAREEYNVAVAQMESAYRAAVSDTRQSFNNVISGIETVKADKQAVRSTQSSLESTDAAFKVGTRTIIDVLAIQSNLYDVQRRLASDTYVYINATLSLKRAAGQICEDDLYRINKWLTYRKRPPVKQLNSGLTRKKTKKTTKIVKSKRRKKPARVVRKTAVKLSKAMTKAPTQHMTLRKEPVKMTLKKSTPKKRTAKKSTRKKRHA